MAQDAQVTYGYIYWKRLISMIGTGFSSTTTEDELSRYTHDH